MMKSIQTLWYVIPAIASEYPSQYIHHTREAGSRLMIGPVTGLRCGAYFIRLLLSHDY